MKTPVISTSQMHKLRFRKVKSIAQDYASGTAGIQFRLAGFQVHAFNLRLPFSTNA